MTHETFTEVAVPKPGGIGAPAVITHDIYLTQHGIVQGWTTSGGAPVAVVNQRSTYGHDVDSVVGFMRWGEPALTHDVTQLGCRARPRSTTRSTGSTSTTATPATSSAASTPSGRRTSTRTCPTWGTGNAEWQGFLPAVQHVHETNPAQGFFVSWNNKPAPQFSAADDQYGYGPVYRSVLLVNQLKAQLAAHDGKLTRANVVTAMATAATQDLDGVTVLPQLLAYLQNRPEPPGVAAMLDDAAELGRVRRAPQEGGSRQTPSTTTRPRSPSTTP